MMNIKSPLELLSANQTELSINSFKAKLMILITTLIRDEKWTQKNAADALGVSQPRISNIMNGQISKFSIDMLLEMIGKLDHRIDISFDRHLETPLSVSIKKVSCANN